jgi:glucose-6-phosphate 1-dehydrogenase
MLDPDLSLHWVRRRDGYLSLEDLDIMGADTTTALVGLDGASPWLCPLTLTAQLAPADLAAYGRLLELLHGNTGLSIRGREAEEAWRVLAPVVSAWSEGLVPSTEYTSGSAGRATVRDS